MKKYLEGRHNSTFLDLSTSCRRMVSFTQEKTRRTHCIEAWIGPSAYLYIVEYSKFFYLLEGIVPLLSSPLLFALLSEPSRLIQWTVRNVQSVFQSDNLFRLIFLIQQKGIETIFRSPSLPRGRVYRGIHRHRALTLYCNVYS
jgi:hypothetical protein